MKKKFFSLILVFLMAFSVVPGISVNAEGAAQTVERIVPVTAVAELSTATASGYDIAAAVNYNPSSVDNSGHVVDDMWLSENPGTDEYAYLTVDLGRVMDVTKAYFYCSTSTYQNRANEIWISTDGETFIKNTTGTRETKTWFRDSLYGMGGRYANWNFSTPVEARYIRVQCSTAKTAMGMSGVTVYARTFVETPALETLTVDKGALSPAFSPDVYDYTVEVDDLSSLPVISATAPEGYTAQITQMEAAGNYSDNYVARVTVAASDVSTDAKIYTVRALSTEHYGMLPVTYQERGCDPVTNASYYSLDGGIDLSNPTTMYFSSNGKSSNNTYANQYSPYYTVDLGRLAEVKEVRFNQRMNNDAKSASTKGDSNTASKDYFEKLEVSTDGINFTDVTVTPTAGIGSDNIYGLAYYQISFDLESSPVVARYIRVSNNDAKSLWIRGTEVFGKLLGDGITHSLDDAKATATYKVQDGHDDARIILALYKIVEDGIDNTPDATLNFVDVKMSDAATNGIVTAEYTIPDGKTDEYVVKAFVLDSMGTIVPLAPSRGI